MNRRNACVALALVISSASLYSAENMRIGTWKVNLDKSTYNPGPKPTVASTLRIEAAGDGEKVSVNGVADGKQTNYSYTSTTDGKPYATPGSPYGDHAMTKIVDARTSEMTYTTNGKVTRRARRTVSADGKTLTIVSKGTNAKGEQYSNTVVYEKQ
ncbi:MAG TPA: hypothetical protein VEX68_27770 [Bryobacteraceae bacterium]|nr:hypothetical protein [Bryobacteraceae bacterium]